MIDGSAASAPLNERGCLDGGIRQLEFFVWRDHVDGVGEQTHALGHGDDRHLSVPRKHRRELTAHIRRQVYDDDKGRAGLV